MYLNFSKLLAFEIWIPKRRVLQPFRTEKELTLCWKHNSYMYLIFILFIYMSLYSWCFKLLINRAVLFRLFHLVTKNKNWFYNSIQITVYQEYCHTHLFHYRNFITCYMRNYFIFIYENLIYSCNPTFSKQKNALQMAWRQSYI